MIEVRGYLKKVFDSRFRKVSDDIINFCAEEIDKMNLTEEMLIDGTEDIINDDEMVFTLPKIKKAYRQAKIKWLEKNNRLLPYDDSPKCPYCENTGTTIYALKFNKSGNLVSQNTVLRCHCDNAVNDIKHVRNVKNAVMHTRDGYIKAYTKIQWTYIMPTIHKTKKDVVIDWANNVKYKEFCRNLAVQNESLRSLAKRTLESMPKCE